MAITIKCYAFFKHHLESMTVMGIMQFRKLNGSKLTILSKLKKGYNFLLVNWILTVSHQLPIKHARDTQFLDEQGFCFLVFYQKFV